MRITRWGEYGVHICAFLAKRQDQHPDIPVSASEIAEQVQIGSDYALQILQRLKNGSLIISTRGSKGGYCLAKDKNEITLKDILLATEGETFELMCESAPLHTQCCDSNSSCGLKGIWGKLQVHVDEFLISYTLNDLEGLFFKEKSQLISKIGSQ